MTVIYSNSWSGGLAEWIEGDTAFISVAFSWMLPKAYQRAIWYSEQNYKVLAGGPAVKIQPEYLKDVARIKDHVTDAIAQHNPNATFTSRGCVRNCKFCIVPKIEGKLKELDDFPIRPIICDNNFLACSRSHFDRVIDKLKPLRGIDFNQGLDARLITKYQANRLAELNIKKGRIRLAYDYIGMEGQITDAFSILVDAGFRAYNIRCYVLIGNEPIKSCYERVKKIIELKGEPFCQPMLSLKTLEKKPVVRYDWTEQKLKDMARWSNRYIWRKLSLQEYTPRRDQLSLFEELI